MDEYEIRILKDERIAINLMVQSNAAMAIRTGQKMAEGRAFEIWRNNQCFHRTAGNTART